MQNSRPCWTPPGFAADHSCLWELHKPSCLPSLMIFDVFFATKKEQLLFFSFLFLHFWGAWCFWLIWPYVASLEWSTWSRVMHLTDEELKLKMAQQMVFPVTQSQAHGILPWSLVKRTWNPLEDFWFFGVSLKFTGTMCWHTTGCWCCGQATCLSWRWKASILFIFFSSEILDCLTCGHVWSCIAANLEAYTSQQATKRCQLKPKLLLSVKIHGQKTVLDHGISQNFSKFPMFDSVWVVVFG